MLHIRSGPIRLKCVVPQKTFQSKPLKGDIALLAYGLINLSVINVNKNVYMGLCSSKKNL